MIPASLVSPRLSDERIHEQQRHDATSAIEDETRKWGALRNRLNRNVSAEQDLRILCHAHSRLTLWMSHEEGRAESAGNRNQQSRAPPHWLNPLVSQRRSFLH